MYSIFGQLEIIYFPFYSFLLYKTSLSYIISKNNNLSTYQFIYRDKLKHIIIEIKIHRDIPSFSVFKNLGRQIQSIHNF